MRELLRQAAVGAALLTLVVVALLRLPPLATGEPRTARNEVGWYHWTVRHPQTLAMLESVPRTAEPGTRVLWVLPRGVDRRWFEARALYQLPATWPRAIERGTPPPADGWDLRIDLYPGGRVVTTPAPSPPSSPPVESPDGGGSSDPGDRS